MESYIIEFLLNLFIFTEFKTLKIFGALMLRMFNKIRTIFMANLIKPQYSPKILLNIDIYLKKAVYLIY